MPNLFSTYRFTVSDGLTPTTVHPVNSGLRFKWEKDEGKFFREKLNTELRFIGEDYTYFKDLLDAGDCVEISLLIERYCAGAWADRFEGLIPIFEGKYDFDRCEVIFKVKENDVYQCVQTGINKKYNFLTFSSAVEVETLYGTVETTQCDYSSTHPSPGTGNSSLWFYKDCWDSGFTNSADPDPTTCWSPYQHTQLVSGADLVVSTIWAREKVTSVSEPPGSGWVDIGGGDWARPINYATITDATNGDERTYTGTYLDATISNGRLLNDLITEAVDAMGCDILEVRSDFFGINSDGTNPTNTAYDWAKDVDGVMQSVVIFQKSDIVNENAVTDATRMEMSLLDLLDDLSNCLNIAWALQLDGTDTIFRIEHITYFEGLNNLDLTTLDDGIHVEGKNQFTIDDEIPTYESFAYQEAFSFYFTQRTIDYPSYCSTAPPLERSLKLMSADVAGLLNNAEAGLLGFVYVCTYSDGAGGYLLDSTDSLANGAMTWYNLFLKLWAFGRYSFSATGPNAFTPETIRKRKNQTRITIPFSCDTFDPSGLVKTGLGWGEVKDAEEDTERGTLTLNLLQE